MRHARPPLVALLLELSGCAAFRQLDRPDAAPAKPDDPWTVAAFFVERDLARAGLLEQEPDPREHRDYCARRQQAATPGASRRDPAEVSAP